MGLKVLEISVPVDRWSRERFARWIKSKEYGEGEIEESDGRLVVKLAAAAAGEKVETRKGGRGLEVRVVKPADPPAGGKPAVSIWDRSIGELLDTEVI